mmetsp:Transcript_80436/g.179965  ORF Transcript_80436/g.179965 Transcript_80436/m.179965 type:complete len:533 (+) Transcript_80436:995-2593(+)
MALADAIVAAVHGLLHLGPGARALAAAASLGAMRPRAPEAPHAVHRARLRVARLLGPRAAVARQATERLPRLLRPDARGGAVAASRRARSPAAPIAPSAVHRAAMSVARLVLLGAADAMGTAELHLLRLGPCPGRHAGAAGLCARRPGSPSVPLAVDRAARDVAVLLLEGSARARLAAPRSLLQDSALAGGHPSSARDGALLPRGPVAPLAVHRAARRVADGFLLGRAVARQAAVLGSRLVADAGLSAAAARLRAVRPMAPSRPSAVRRARLRVARLRDRRQPTAIGAPVLRLDEALPGVRALALAAGLRAIGPGAPIAPLAVHGAANAVARGALLAISLALRATEGRRDLLGARPHSGAVAAGLGALAPAAPRGPDAMHGAVLGVTSPVLEPGARAVLASVLRDGRDAAVADGKAATAGALALRPRAPSGPLAEHGARLRVALRLLLVRADAVLATPLRNDHLRARPLLGASSAGLGAARPSAPVAPLALDGAIPVLALDDLLVAAHTLPAVVLGLDLDLPLAVGVAPAAG